MIQKACNGFVLVIRDKTKSEMAGFIVPSDGRKKPHQGVIHAVGALVKDPNIKAGKGRLCLFHPTVGWEIDFDGVTYLVLQDMEIIALP